MLISLYCSLSAAASLIDWWLLSGVCCSLPGNGRLVLRFATPLSSINLSSFLSALLTYISDTYFVATSRLRVVSVEAVQVEQSTAGLHLQATVSGFQVTVDVLAVTNAESPDAVLARVAASPPAAAIGYVCL
jgi:hypothetical protein